MTKESRHPADHAAADRFTKQVVIWTLCLLAGAFGATVCALVLNHSDVPDTLDRLVTFIVGNLTGVLAKTGVEATLNQGQPLPVVGPDGGAVKTEEVKTDTQPATSPVDF